MPRENPKWKIWYFSFCTLVQSYLLLTILPLKVFQAVYNNLRPNQGDKYPEQKLSQTLRFGIDLHVPHFPQVSVLYFKIRFCFGSTYFSQVNVFNCQ